MKHILIIILFSCLKILNVSYFLRDEFETYLHLLTLDQQKLLFVSLIFISWRLITLQYCSGFCHTLT